MGQHSGKRRGALWRMEEGKESRQKRGREAHHSARGDVMLKFLGGLAAGFGIGMLIAPARGEETRRELLEKARGAAEYPQRKANELLDAVPEKAAQVAAETARQAAEQAVGKVREKTGLPPTGSEGRG